MALIVTRHPALVDYLQEQGIISGDERVIAHATPEEVEGQDVIGVLPLSLAVHARTVTEVPLALTPEDRGQELSVERLNEIAGEPRTYTVQELHGVRGL